MKVNFVSLGLIPGVGIAGYLFGGWGGVLVAEGVWAGAVFIGTLIHWLPHPDGRLRADPSEPLRHQNRRHPGWGTRSGAAANDRPCAGRQVQSRPN